MNKTIEESEVIHETEMLQAGQDKFLQAMENTRTRVGKDGVKRKVFQESSSVYGHSLLKEYIKDVSIELQRRLKQMRGSRGRLPVAHDYMNLLDSEVTAMVALKTVLDSLSMDITLTSLTKKIGNKLEDQAKFDNFAVSDPRIYTYLQKKFKADGTTDYRHKKRVMQHSMNVSLDEEGNRKTQWVEWPERHKIHVGAEMVYIVMQATGLIEQYFRRKFKAGVMVKQNMIGPSQKADDLIRTSLDDDSYYTPCYLPMLCKPDDWTDTQSGGYITSDLKQRTPLIKERRRKLQRRHLKRSKAGKMDTFLKAANYLQSTEYVIDEFILDIVMKEWQTPNPVGIPSVIPFEPTPCPLGTLERSDFDTPAEFREAMRIRREFMTQEEKQILGAWKTESTIVYTKEKKRKSKSWGIYSTMKIANQLRTAKSLFFVAQACTRGRLYSVGTALNPQGHGVAKALLKFKTGALLGETGEYSQYINACGVFGVDKVSLEDRVKWVVDNKHEIRGCATNPDEYRWFWRDADKPYCFLQACVELNNIWTAKELGLDVTTLRTYNGCPQDGSCNGMQHFNAILRDAEGGKLVNLIDSDVPGDLYTAMADKAMGYARDIVHFRGDYKDATTNDFRLAEQWLRFGITRNDAKKPVMVFPYGGSQQGTVEHFTLQIEERIDASGDPEYKPFGEPTPTGSTVVANKNRKKGEAKRYVPEMQGGVREAAEFINKLMWKSLIETLKPADKAMKWIKKVALAATKYNGGTSLSYVISETGFEVVQSYNKSESYQVETQLAGKLTIRSDTKEVDAGKHSRSASPNFIHSLDTTHLVLVLCRCADEGIIGFTAVHDSFSVNAGDVVMLHIIIRETFMELHSTCQLTAWVNQFKFEEKDLKKIASPESLKVGTLDLTEILFATFLFR